MSMGSTMMQQADLRRKEVEAKGLPSSVSKRQVAITGVATMIPGNQALSACTSQELADMFDRAKGINVEAVERMGSKYFEVGSHPRVILKDSYTRKGKNLFVSLRKPTGTDFDLLFCCSDESCPLVNAVSSDKVENVKAVMKSLENKILGGSIEELPLQHTSAAEKKNDQVETQRSKMTEDNNNRSQPVENLVEVKNSSSPKSKNESNSVPVSSKQRQQQPSKKQQVAKVSWCRRLFCCEDKK